jgi:hypothetical protein
MNELLSDMERSVIQMLLNGDAITFRTLREQLIHCHVSHRTLTGVGFITDLEVDPTIARLTNKGRIIWGDVLADMEGIQNGVGFVLVLENGYLRMLEGYSFGEPWPEQAKLIRLRYEDKNRRKIPEVLRT